jgi:diguanylate cyclase (GGDEF)-like protein
VNEIELAEIESRLEQYPAQARRDIIRLTAALRTVAGTPPAAPAPTPAFQATSPLYDPLTGLLNGGAYGVRFAMARARSTRYKKIFAVMSIEIAFGASDAVSDDDRDLTIQEVAGRLERNVRATDTLARIGNADFAVILEDLTHAAHAERVKQIVQDALSEPLVIRGRTVAPQIRVGIDFYPAPDAGAAGSTTH